MVARRLGRPVWQHCRWRRKNHVHPRGFATHAPQIETATVTDAAIQKLAAKPLHPLTLTDLVEHGRPPLTERALLASANFTLSILPQRLAHRIQALRNLPFIVVSNPQITAIHHNYLHSLSTLLPWAEKRITTLEEEIRFTQCMADLVQTHNNTIPTLARGFLESRRYIPAADVTKFLDAHLRARIGTRLIAEQHIALHFSSLPHAELSSDHAASYSHAKDSSYIGVIDTRLKPADVIHSCEAFVGEVCELKYGVRPCLRVTGEPDAELAHIPVHVEYVVTELLKNAFRAVVERGMEREPIEVTIAPTATPQQHHDILVSTFDQGHRDEEDLLGASMPEAAVSEYVRPLTQPSAGVTIRIRDRGGGIAPTNLRHLWDYGFTTFDERAMQESIRAGGASGGTNETPAAASTDALTLLSAGAGIQDHSLAGLGYGLPLGRAYAEYFGGGISVQSLFGWGTDVYLSLRGVGQVA